MENPEGAKRPPGGEAAREKELGAQNHPLRNPPSRYHSMSAPHTFPNALDLFCRQEDGKPASLLGPCGPQCQDLAECLVHAPAPCQGAKEDLNEPSNPSPVAKLDSWAQGWQRAGPLLPRCPQAQSLTPHISRLTWHLLREAAPLSHPARPPLVILHGTFPS